MIDHTPVSHLINDLEVEQKLLQNELYYAVTKEDMGECNKIENRLHIVDTMLSELYKKYNLEAEKNKNELCDK
jgi:hypothetical protein